MEVPSIAKSNAYFNVLTGPSVRGVWRSVMANRRRRNRRGRGSNPAASVLPSWANDGVFKCPSWAHDGTSSPRNDETSSPRILGLEVPSLAHDGVFKSPSLAHDWVSPSLAHDGVSKSPSSANDVVFTLRRGAAAPCLSQSPTPRSYADAKDSFTAFALPLSPPKVIRQNDGAERR